MLDMDDTPGFQSATRTPALRDEAVKSLPPIYYNMLIRKHFIAYQHEQRRARSSQLGLVVVEGASGLLTTANSLVRRSISQGLTGLLVSAN